LKSKTLCITALTLLTALSVPLRLAAQDKDNHNDEHRHHHYKLIDIGTFGGPNSTVTGFEQVVNDRGMVTGGADTPTPDPSCVAFNFDCFVSHAFKWQDGVLTDLGALPGVNSSYANRISANGLVAGMSENGEIDPLIGVPELRAAFWNDAHIIDLGTLGGNESFATAVNNRGQVVGVGANAIPDPFCYFGWGTQCRAFLWQNGVMRDLGTLGGPNSAAAYVNDAGMVAGWSDISSTPNPITKLPPNHPFLWKDGTMRDLGTIGGTQVFDLDGLNERGQVSGEMTLADEQKSFPFLWDGKKLIDLGTFGGDHGNANALNDAGEVTGYAQYAISCPEPGAGPIAHAYLWRKGVKTDLGTVPGINPLDGGSTGWSINSKTQIVGISTTCDFSIEDAFLWEEGGPMIDLNALIPPDSPMHLYWAFNINDRGEIAGLGALSNGHTHAFLLIPCDEDHGDSDCEGEGEGTAVARRETNQRPNVVLPENVRRILGQRLGSRYHVPKIVTSPRD
jgi:probable HAF family extracellular repeat protein